VFIVRLIGLCPSVSITTRGWTPWTSRNEAHAWRRSWRRIGGSSARFNKLWNRCVTFGPSASVPRSLGSEVIEARVLRKVHFAYLGRTVKQA
jgi:hypothetical protein